MWSWFRKNGNTKTGELELKEKLVPYKKKIVALEEEANLLAAELVEAGQKIDGQETVITCILYQFGGKIEITKETVDVVNKLSKHHEMKMENTDNSLIIQLQRRDPINA